MSIYVAYDIVRKLYAIRKLITDHNHAHGPAEYEMYSAHRQPAGPLQEQTVAMLRNGANPTLVTASLNQQRLHTRARDLYNMKNQL